MPPTRSISCLSLVLYGIRKGLIRRRAYAMKPGFISLNISAALEVDVLEVGAVSRQIVQCFVSNVKAALQWWLK